MIYDFDRRIERRESDSIKWGLYDEDVVPLWVADTDFLAPPSLIKSLHERIDHGIFGYAKPQESTKNVIQNWVYDRHGWKVKSEDIILLSGVVQGFNFAAKAFTAPGDAVLIQTPAYHPFFQVAENSNLTQVSIPLAHDPDGSYYFNEDEFRSALTTKSKIFMLCNPHNPTGRTFSKIELNSMAQVCLENNIIICSDEIHCDLVYPEAKHIPIASLSEDIANNTISLLSASKTFNIAGLKSSAAIITNPGLREIFIKTTSGFAGSVNLLGELALRTAYEVGENWLNELLSYLNLNRNYLFDYVNSELPGIRMIKPEGTYLGWLNCSELGLKDPSKFFLEEARVALNAGSWFGENYSQFVRINFGCPTNTLATGLERIKFALNSL
jgi:cystathionine beta-lyase